MVKIGPAVLPTAIAEQASQSVPTLAFTAKAPINTPGQCTHPQRYKTATAIPVGNQSNVMLLPNAGIIKPNRPNKKYAAARTIVIRICLTKSARIRRLGLFAESYAISKPGPAVPFVALTPTLS
jgi:hypothetical protein